jgi:hypothetical protein
MNSATIKLFLPFGDPNRLRTAEISNWSGKAVAAPRTDLDPLLSRDELRQPGIYILTGTHPETGKPVAYVGEAEIIRDRLKQHRDKDFWVHAVVFVSKDENLTRAHIRYLEGRLIADATSAGRMEVINTQSSGARLPESDREDMEVFLGKVHQLLPVLASDIVTPILPPSGTGTAQSEILTCEIKGLIATGRRTTTGFVVFEGSQAVFANRPSAATRHPFVVVLREKLTSDGTLMRETDHLRFVKNTEFSSPSTAAAVIHGGGANGLLAWKNREGKMLKQIESEQRA